MYGETFYGCNTAQHQLQCSQIKISFASIWVLPRTVTNLLDVKSGPLLNKNTKTPAGIFIDQ